MVPLPVGTRARDIVCDYDAKTLKFGRKGKAPIVSGPMPKRIKTSECSWTLGTVLTDSLRRRIAVAVAWSLRLLAGFLGFGMARP